MGSQSRVNSMDRVYQEAIQKIDFIDQTLQQNVFDQNQKFKSNRQKYAEMNGTFGKEPNVYGIDIAGNKN